MAGKLRDRVSFYRIMRGQQVDQYGNPQANAFQLHHRTWGELTEFVGDGEEVQLIKGVMQSRERARLRVRITAKTKEISADDRVQARGNTWTIQGVAQLGATERWLEFRMEAVPAVRQEQEQK